MAYPKIMSGLSKIYIWHIQKLNGLVPLFPCFLHGNATSTIPYKYTARQKQAFEFGCADGASKESRRGSHVYEINTWLWNFGRPQPRVGGLSVAKTERLGRPGRPESAVQLKRTRKRPVERYDMHIPGIYLSYMNAQ